MYGLATYATQPYGQYTSRGSVDAIALEDRFWFCHGQVFFGAVMYLAGQGRGNITGYTVATGNLTGGTYTPPPPIAGLPALDGFIDDSTGIHGNLSGGRAVLALIGLPSSGRTFVSGVLSSTAPPPPPIFLRVQPVRASSIAFGQMDGGTEAQAYVAGVAIVSGLLSGGAALTNPVYLEPDYIVPATHISSNLSGGLAVLDLNGRLFTYATVIGLLSGGSHGQRVFLQTAVAGASLLTANLTGGTTTGPSGPPTPPTGSILYCEQVTITDTSSMTFSYTTANVPPGGDGGGDLPTDPTPGSILVDLVEAVGAGPSSEIVVTDVPVNLCGQDVHSPGDAADNPVPANLDGSPSYSYERWLRVRFVPPFGEVSNFRFWIDPTSIPSGWAVNWGYTEVYTTPTNSRSLIATRQLTQEDPGSTNIGVSNPITGEDTRYSPYLVLQGYFIPDETSARDYVEPPPGFFFHFSYDQS